MSASETTNCEADDDLGKSGSPEDSLKSETSPTAEITTVATEDPTPSPASNATPTRPSLLIGLARDHNDDASSSTEQEGGGGGGGKKLSPFPEEKWGCTEESENELMDGMRKKSVAIKDAKEAAILRLQEELQKSKETLKLRDEEVEKLSKIRDEMDAELEELTASLFEEAHKMVREANVQRASSEKQVAEANLKIEVLTAEVQALKALVLTSTPSTPNRHMHPQISPSPERKPQTSGSPGKSAALVNGGHKRAASHGGTSTNNVLNSSFMGARSSFGAGGASTPPKLNLSANLNDAANIPLPHPCPSKTPHNSETPTTSRVSITREKIDPIAFEEFSNWIDNSPALDSTTPFLARIFAEDILPCFNFRNKELASAMLSAIEANSIVIEPLLPGKNTSLLPKSSAAYGGRQCALSQLSKACNYKVRLDDDEGGGGGGGSGGGGGGSGEDRDNKNHPGPAWHYISDFCRNRVIAVCDFYTYVRYIVQGLVKKKSDAHDTFCHINRLRRNMNLARLGFEPQDV